METIFDFSPTPQEIEQIAFNYLDMRLRLGKWNESPTEDWYRENIKPEWALFDLALLFTSRDNEAAAETYWAQIPAIAQEYKLGLDYQVTAV